jgi:hypothetical protein
MKQITIKDVIADSVDELESLYARSFLFLLYTENHRDIHKWIKRLKTDYVKKQIYIEIYEDTQGQTNAFLESLQSNKNKEKLHLDHLNKKKEVVFTMCFAGLTLAKHSAKYDYGSSSVLTHRILLEYKKIERKIAEKAT